MLDLSTLTWLWSKLEGVPDKKNAKSLVRNANDKYKRLQLYNKYNYITSTIIQQIQILDKYNYMIKHREVISRPDELTGCKFHLILFNLLWSALNPPSNTSTSSSFILIQAWTSFQIWIYILVLRPDLDFCLSTWTGSYLTQIYTQASLLISIFV